MKKNLFYVFILMSYIVNAQTQKGNWVVGGSTQIDFSSGKTTVKYGSIEVDGPTINTLAFTPSVGYFISDNLALGGEVNFTSITYKNEYDGRTYKETSSIFSIMPSVTYYFSNNKTVMPYLGGAVGFATKKDKDDDVTISGDGFAWKLKGGIAYFLTESIALDLGLRYAQHSFNYKDTYYTEDIKEVLSAFGVNAGISVFF